jgi:hypothetical protein
LVPPLAQIPGLSDQFDLGEHRVLVNDIEKRAEFVHLVELPGQGAGQIETKPVDVHFQDPVSKAVHDHLQHPGVGHVQGVAAPGVVHVVPFLPRETVVGRVVDAPPGQRGAQMIAFRRVVVHHVQDHLDAFGVQGAHHHFEFPHRLQGVRTRGVAQVRGEK